MFRRTVLLLVPGFIRSFVQAAVSADNLGGWALPVSVSAGLFGWALPESVAHRFAATDGGRVTEATLVVRSF